MRKRKRKKDRKRKGRKERKASETMCMTACAYGEYNLL